MAVMPSYGKHGKWGADLPICVHWAMMANLIIVVEQGSKPREHNGLWCNWQHNGFWYRHSRFESW